MHLYTNDMQGLVWGEPELPEDVFSFCSADSEALFCILPSRIGVTNLYAFQVEREHNQDRDQNLQRLGLSRDGL